MKKLWAYIAALIAAILMSCGGGSVDTEYMPPEPTVLRQDLWFGYYLTFDEQIAETKDHVNLIHESGWFGVDQTIASMKAHGKPVMLDLSGACYDKTNTPYPDVQERVAAILGALSDAGVLKQVVALYPIDEPDMRGISATQISQVNASVKWAAAVFPELANVKLAVIYTSHNELPGIASYDWVGMDDYDTRSGIFISKPWLAMLAALRPDQRIFLVPGGGDPFRQEPEAFRRYAHNNPQVVGILAFLWATRHDDPQIPDVPGIGTNGLAEKYRAVGKEFINGI